MRTIRYTHKKPIVINDDTIVILHLFRREVSDLSTTLWLSDKEDYLAERITLHEKAASQLLDQLEDHWTPAFLIALRKEITKKLEEHDKEFDTHFAEEEPDNG